MNLTRHIPLVAVVALGLGTAGADARPVCESATPCPPPTQNAGAGTASGTVNVNNGYNLTVRARPNSHSRKVRSVKDHSQVTIVCQTTGSQVTGRYGTSNVWDKLARGGYVSDTYIYTGSDGRVAKDCGGDPTPAPSTGGGGKPASIVGRDDYPFRSDSPNEVDPWAFYKRECTSFVAYRLNKVMPFSNHMRGGHFGNAMTWDDNARKIGMKVNRKPTVGSVMVRNSGSYGHVAMVAKVRPGKVLVEQYNAGGTHTYSKQWLSVTSVMTFIHP